MAKTASKQSASPKTITPGSDDRLNLRRRGLELGFGCHNLKVVVAKIAELRPSQGAEDIALAVTKLQASIDSIPCLANAWRDRLHRVLSDIERNIARDYPFFPAYGEILEEVTFRLSQLIPRDGTAPTGPHPVNGPLRQAVSAMLPSMTATNAPGTPNTIAVMRQFLNLFPPEMEARWLTAWGLTDADLDHPLCFNNKKDLADHLHEFLTKATTRYFVPDVVGIVELLDSCPETFKELGADFHDGFYMGDQLGRALWSCWCPVWEEFDKGLPKAFVELGKLGFDIPSAIQADKLVPARQNPDSLAAESFPDLWLNYLVDRCMKEYQDLHAKLEGSGQEEQGIVDGQREPDANATVTCAQIVQILRCGKKSYGAIQHRLKRFRKNHDNGWIETKAQGKNKAQFLYEWGKVKPFVQGVLPVSDASHTQK